MTAKLSLTHVFPCTPAEFLALFDDPGFEEVQSRESNVQREVVEARQHADGTWFKRVRCKPTRPIPGFLRPFVGADGLLYFQLADVDPAKGLIRWSVEVPALGERVKVDGITRLEPHPEGCKRTIEGEVTVNVRLVGGQIERYVADDVQKSYEKTAKAMATYIASRRTS